MKWNELGVFAAGTAIAYKLVQRLRSYSFEGKSVFVSGGARGLGLLVARRLADEGASLTIVSRNDAQVEIAARELRSRGAKVLAFGTDLRDRQSARVAIGRHLDMHGGIDVLINNAGVIQVGPLEHMKAVDFRSAMAIHFWAPLHLILAAVPHMREAGEGRIVNVTSVGGKVAVPHLAPYVASKFALTGLSDAIRAELAKDGISVTTVAPWLMRTGSYVNALFKGNHEAELSLFGPASSLPFLTVGAERAASQIVEATRRGDESLDIGVATRLVAIANAVAPGLVGKAAKLVAQLLPGPVASVEGDESKPGRETVTPTTPSILTVLSDRAARRNNEHPRPARERARLRGEGEGARG